MCKQHPPAVSSVSQRDLIIEAIDELGSINGKLKLLLLSVSYILDEHVGIDESLGFTNIMFDLLKQIEKTKGTLKLFINGGVSDE